jgi:hypothetical protein
VLTTAVLAQNSLAVASRTQTAAAALATLPEADLLIYVSPQRILNDAAPRVVAPAEITKMRAAFFDIKRSAGIDPATVEYLVIAVRFQRPSGELSFVAPDVMVVMGGDYSADSLLSLAQLYLQDKVQSEKYGSKTISLMKVDPIVAEAEKNPILKNYTEVSAVSLSANSLAIGNTRYIKAAVDAADGNGRINPAVIESLLRDPNALIAASGSPLTSFAKSVGLLGTETSPRAARCDTRFGDFYAAITMSGTTFNLRGAMNTDNPDTAKIINGLLSVLMKEGIDSVPDKGAQEVLKQIRMTPKDNEIVWDADIPQEIVANFIKEQTTPKVEAIKEKAPTPPRRKKRRVARK